MIPLVIILPCICRKRHSIRLRIIRTRKNPIHPILIQNIRIKKVAESRTAMALRIRGRLIARGGAYAGIVWLRLRKGLDTHVAVVGRGCIDGCVAEVGGASEACDYHRRLVVDVGAPNDDMKLGLVLSGVGSFGSGHHGAEEGTLDAGDGGRSWAVDVVSVQGGIALEVWWALDG
jgi:hypothetical protein